MFKNLYKGCISALIVILLVSACAPANPAQDQRLGNLESKVNTLSNLQTALTSLQDEVTDMKMEHTNDADLQTRLDGLQAQVNELAAQVEMTHSETASADATAPAEHTDDPFAVSVAQYFMDTAGFHGIAETISKTQTVDPAYLSTVNRVHKVLVATTWPETLSEQGHAFTTLLEEFSAALEADDAAQSTELADQVHDAQHELSHAIDAWLGTVVDEHTH